MSAIYTILLGATQDELTIEAITYLFRYQTYNTFILGFRTHTPAMSSLADSSNIWKPRVAITEAKTTIPCKIKIKST